MCDIPGTESRATCSDYCETVDRRPSDEIVCQCGHPKCSAEMQRELSGDMA